MRDWATGRAMGSWALTIRMLALALIVGVPALQSGCGDEEAKESASDGDVGSHDAGGAGADGGPGLDDVGTGERDAEPSGPDLGVDGGPRADAGRADTGPEDVGPEDLGPADLGLADLGPADTGPADAGSQDAGPADAGGQPWDPPFDPGVCGAANHQWVAPDRVGQPVTWEPATIAHVSLEQVRALAQEEGYEDWLEVRHGVRVYNLRYRTQDRGQVVEATAAVGIPDDLPAGQPAPVLVWLHGTSGFMDDCAPSADAREAIVAPVVLATQGYIAVAPDFVGMNGFGPPSPPGTIMPYLVAEPTALSSIDGLRATLTSLQHNSAELPVGDTERLRGATQRSSSSATCRTMRPTSASPPWRLPCRPWTCSGSGSGGPATSAPPPRRWPSCSRRCAGGMALRRTCWGSSATSLQPGWPATCMRPWRRAVTPMIC